MLFKGKWKMEGDRNAKGRTEYPVHDNRFKNNRVDNWEDCMTKVNM